MLKKFMYLGATVIFSITMLSGPAQAHYFRTSTGYTIWHSTKCDIVLKAVPNPDSNPAQFECFVIVTLVDSLCLNPQNKTVNPGQSATQTTIVTTENLTPANITDKKKGLAHVDAIVPDDPLLRNEFCVNPNWNIIDVLVREATVQFNVYQCADTTCNTKVLHNTSEFECRLPNVFNFSNPPPVGEPYECMENFSAHL